MGQLLLLFHHGTRNLSPITKLLAIAVHEMRSCEPKDDLLELMVCFVKFHISNKSLTTLVAIDCSRDELSLMNLAADHVVTRVARDHQ